MMKKHAKSSQRPQHLKGLILSLTAILLLHGCSTEPSAADELKRLLSQKKPIEAEKLAKSIMLERTKFADHHTSDQAYSGAFGALRVVYEAHVEHFETHYGRTSAISQRIET